MHTNSIIGKVEVLYERYCAKISGSINKGRLSGIHIMGRSLMHEL